MTRALRWTAGKVLDAVETVQDYYSLIRFRLRPRTIPIETLIDQLGIAGRCLRN